MGKPTYKESAKKIKDLEEELGESEIRKIWDAYSQSPIPTLVLRKDGKILMYNNAMYGMTGYAHNEVPDVETWMPKVYPAKILLNSWAIASANVPSKSILCLI